MTRSEPFSEDEFDQGTKAGTDKRHTDDTSDLQMGKKQISDDIALLKRKLQKALVLDIEGDTVKERDSRYANTA